MTLDELIDAVLAALEEAEADEESARLAEEYAETAEESDDGELLLWADKAVSHLEGEDEAPDVDSLYQRIVAILKAMEPADG